MHVPPAARAVRHARHLRGRMSANGRQRRLMRPQLRPGRPLPLQASDLSDAQRQDEETASLSVVRPSAALDMDAALAGLVSPVAHDCNEPEPRRMRRPHASGETKLDASEHAKRLGLLRSLLLAVGCDTQGSVRLSSTRRLPHPDPRPPVGGRASADQWRP